MEVTWHTKALRGPVPSLVSLRILNGKVRITGGRNETVFLRENNKAGFAADLEENPHCQVVCDESSKKM